MKFKIYQKYDLSGNKPSQHSWLETRPNGALGVDWFVNVETIEDLQVLAKEHGDSSRGTVTVVFGLHPTIEVASFYY